MRFGRLVEEARGAQAYAAARLLPIARERLAAAAVAATPLRALSGSAPTAGFVRELLRLVDELEELRVTPQRLTKAPAGVGRGGPGPARLRRRGRRAIQRLPATARAPRAS